MSRNIKRVLAAWLIAPVLFSCATYNKSMDGYYANIREHNYSKAMKAIERNRLIKKNRNALLYNLELGRLHLLKNDPVRSNLYLNRADDLMEINRKTVADIAIGNLVNPMHETYRGEDFEQFMVHYYKALNYAALGQIDEAVVEARRITLSNNSQGNKFRDKESRYSKDAFALNLQGMIYEMAGDMNNSFIAYRNAADAYTTAGNEYYGVRLPAQLQNDLLRTVTAMGFADEQMRYESAFNVAYRPSTSEGGELILFLEEGRAPVKQEKNFILTSGSNGIGSFNYVDADGYNADFNFNYGAYGIREDKLSSVRALRVAMPAYSIQYTDPQQINVSNNAISYPAQLVQNINSVAVNVLRERFPTELGKALARQLTKKIVEKGAEAAAEGIAKSNDKKEDQNADDAEKEKQKKKNEENAKQAGQVAGFLMNMVNTASEKADTRNWQSLPAFVSYVRIPLTAGENSIVISTNGKTQNLKVIGGKGLQMRGIVID